MVVSYKKLASVLIRYAVQKKKLRTIKSLDSKQIESLCSAYNSYLSLQGYLIDLPLKVKIEILLVEIKHVIKRVLGKV